MQVFDLFGDPNAVCRFVGDGAASIATRSGTDAGRCAETDQGWILSSSFSDMSFGEKCQNFDPQT